MSAVQANDMILKMAMSGGAAPSDPEGCVLCGGDEGDGERANCPPVCLPMVHALVLPALTIAIDSVEVPWIMANGPPRGTTGVPEPSPPRLSIPG